jgi:hypothetical protein
MGEATTAIVVCRKVNRKISDCLFSLISDLSSR